MLPSCCSPAYASEMYFVILNQKFNVVASRFIFPIHLHIQHYHTSELLLASVCFRDVFGNFESKVQYGRQQFYFSYLLKMLREKSCFRG